MVRATRRGGAWILETADAVVRIKTTRAGLVVEVVTLVVLRNRVAGEVVLLTGVFWMTRRRRRRLSVGLRALAETNRVCYREAFWLTTAR